MKTLNISNLEKRSTDAGQDQVTMHSPEIMWRGENIVLAYENAFGKEIADVFNVALCLLDDGTCVLHAIGSSGQPIERFVPADWADKDNVPFTAYDGEYDDLPGAGLNSDIVQLSQKGQKTAAALNDEAMKSEEA